MLNQDQQHYSPYTINLFIYQMKTIEYISSLRIPDKLLEDGIPDKFLVSNACNRDGVVLVGIGLD